MHAYRAVSSRFLSLFRLSDGFDKCHVTLHNDLMHSIAINDQWRVCFRFVNGDAYDVEITDYH